jgi:hypothetical protein
VVRATFVRNYHISSHLGRCLQLLSATTRLCTFSDNIDTVSSHLSSKACRLLTIARTLVAIVEMSEVAWASRSPIETALQTSREYADQSRRLWSSVSFPIECDRNER